MSRRHQIENIDLRSDKPRGMSRQSRRREALNLTKRARAAKVHAQPITNFFTVSHTLHSILLCTHPFDIAGTFKKAKTGS